MLLPLVLCLPMTVVVAERGTIFFCKKLLNCMKPGGVAAVIYNMDTGDDCQPLNGTLLSTEDDGCSNDPDTPSEWPVTFAVSRRQGLAILAAAKLNPTIQLTLQTCSGSRAALGYSSGTSMVRPGFNKSDAVLLLHCAIEPSCVKLHQGADFCQVVDSLLHLHTAAAAELAHQFNAAIWCCNSTCKTDDVGSACGLQAAAVAAGAAGLVWSAHPFCTAAELRAAVSATAADLGAPGRDPKFGHGLVQALAAHQYLLTQPCINQPPPQPPPPPRPPSPPPR